MRPINDTLNTVLLFPCILCLLGFGLFLIIETIVNPCQIIENKLENWTIDTRNLLCNCSSRVLVLLWRIFGPNNYILTCLFTSGWFRAPVIILLITGPACVASTVCFFIFLTFVRHRIKRLSDSDVEQIIRSTYHSIKNCLRKCQSFTQQGNYNTIRMERTTWIQLDAPFESSPNKLGEDQMNKRLSGHLPG